MDKILTIHNKYLISGGEDQSVSAQEAIMKEQGHDYFSYIRDNKEVSKMNQLATGINTIWSQKSYGEVINLIKENNIDIVDVQNTFPLISPSIYYAAKKFRKPVIQTLRNYRLICSNGLFFRNGDNCFLCLQKKIPMEGIKNKCYRNSTLGSTAVTSMLGIHNLFHTYKDKIDVFITLTEYMKEIYSQAGFPKDRIVVRANFVPKDPGVGEGKGNYFLFVGRLTKEKGVLTLIEAFTKNKTDKLIIIGQGPLEQQVDQCAKKHSNIEYLGRKNIEEVYEFMKNAKAVIFPSEWYEPFGRIFIESFAVGTPVISSDVPSIYEMVEDNRTGLHFKAGNSTSLTEAIEKFNASSNLLYMRSEARKEYLSKYTPEIYYKKTMEIYKYAKEINFY
ncbi:glycosyl transferase family 1 [Priestia megaterium]|uniref:glycosyltransferase n=1 Tax=Priestia megaterium TaxID=1404 RepID=UPI000BFD0794|nr:glycosyltransferase [Priestia megaterium]PGK31198.1 glycosyl transferase family 1 [Priestia megaterium]